MKKRKRLASDKSSQLANGQAATGKCGPWFIGVHAGVGYHAPAVQPNVDEAMKKACRAAARELHAGRTAMEAVAKAIAVLEDDPHCNAGLGSNLTMEGNVECDASVMEDTGAFGAVAAVAGMRHPIQAAAGLLHESKKSLPCGLVSPMMLASDGARRWALERGLGACVDPKGLELVTPAARRQWQRYRRMYDTEVERVQRKQQQDACLPPPSSVRAQTMDTVGAVVVSSDGRIATGVSSGGIALKHQGRVGEAALFGAGCWAERWTKDDESAEGAQSWSLGISTTGVGERVLSHLLSKAAGERVRQSSDRETNNSQHSSVSGCLAKLLRDTVLQGRPPHDAGMICVLVNRSDQGVCVEFGAAHCGQSMAVAMLHDREEASFMMQDNRVDTQGQDASVKELAFSVRWDIPSQHC